MFDSLTDRLEGVFKKIRGHARLTEENVQAALREVRLALLEADVNFKVVKDFVERVRDRAMGQDVLKSLTPGQQVVKIVHDELIELLGGQTTGLDLKARPTAIMMVGLQGSGKTTTSAKLALRLRRELKKKAYLVPADVYRPAAIEQLKKLGSQIDISVHPSTPDQNPVDICAQAMDVAATNGFDVVIFDTAGRLHVDETLMEELAAIKARTSPAEILFVADAMTGQDAVTVAASFNDRLDVSGIVLTKMDGDARGGAALSIKGVTGKPIKFVGMGEKLADLEIFHPDRAASRILGMGDILTLIEKAQTDINAEEAAAMEKKLRKAEFNLEDFRTQMRRVRKLGSLDGILKLIPGMSQVRQKLGEVQMPEKEMARVEAIIGSMTKKERENPKIINPSRRERIAKGSGSTVQDVAQLLKNFTQMQKMMKRMMGAGGKMPAPGKMPRMPKMPGLPGGMPGLPGGDPGEAPPVDPRFARTPGKVTSASKRKKQKRKKGKSR
ncbi:signal recognition particle protein [Desulfolutivibrio sulfoxidireducens]|uniref:signal recognition particle protein n=1 Tax=Desulfolutivibrio sulfoxidireducens TaxID=2773299 RepID=UPI00159DFA85|nr:signal recognition particle protein [Desulfolutivibrio sulfoxidireducens]QLA20683.1 signal recognition particle protein [Desulfolutivibrio sulfoxidireducens]